MRAVVLLAFSLAAVAACGGQPTQRAGDAEAAASAAAAPSSASNDVGAESDSAFAALLGVANAIETPVRQAFVSELVEHRLLPNALALSAATFNTARIGGPGKQPL